MKSEIDGVDQHIYEMRKLERFSHLSTQELSQAACHFFSLASDQGVIRNGGRRGAFFAPQVLDNQWKTFSPPLLSRQEKKCPLWMHHHFTLNDLQNPKNFMEEQHFYEKQITKTLSHIKKPSLLGQWGGGHDHIYPYISALMQIYPDYHFRIFNLDAHADTRTDPWAHSGTPFRQLAERFRERLSLHQLGLHEWSNPLANFSMPLLKEYFVMSVEETERFTHADWRKLFAPREKEISFLSLDADALESSVMKGVSAVNAFGLTGRTVQNIFHLFGAASAQAPERPTLFGIYEYNPLEEGRDLSGAKFLTQLVYQLYDSRFSAKN
jgi:formiminoglutamase